MKKIFAVTITLPRKKMDNVVQDFKVTAIDRKEAMNAASVQFRKEHNLGNGVAVFATSCKEVLPLKPTVGQSFNDFLTASN